MDILLTSFSRVSDMLAHKRKSISREIRCTIEHFSSQRTPAVYILVERSFNLVNARIITDQCNCENTFLANTTMFLIHEERLKGLDMH